MQKYYQVNEDVRKQLIAEMRQREKTKMAKAIVLYRVLYVVAALVFLIPLIWMMPQAAGALSAGHTDDMMGFLIIIVFAFCIALLVSIIPNLVRQKAEKEYLWKWSGRTQECVLLQQKSLKWEHYDKFEGNSYWEYQMQYADVKSLKYNSAEKILYVYGYMGGKQWDGVNRNQLVDEIELDRSLEPVPWMTLPEYFDGFEDLKQSLEKMTGKRVENAR